MQITLPLIKQAENAADVENAAEAENAADVK
jgi:hypothetical protein